MTGYVKEGSYRQYDDVSGPEPESIMIDAAYFRIVTHHDVGTDSLVTRFDVRDATEGKQANGALFCWPKSTPVGEAIKRTDPLLLPAKGIEGGYTIVADRKTLAGILRGLADKLDERS